jgi:histidinol-phosphatase
MLRWTGDDDVDVAHRLADVATAACQSLRHSRLRRRHKADGSIVTDADLCAERAMLDILALVRPLDAILAEEGGVMGGVSRRRWLLDPIDGTSEFVEGGIRWGSHVALEVHGVVEVAVMTRPALSVRWWAVRGRGTHVRVQTSDGHSDRRLAVSRCAKVAEARVGGIVDPGSPSASALAESAEWQDDDVSIVAALCEGRVDVVVDDGGAPWDLAPAVLLTVEAGGMFSDPEGGSRLDLGWGLFTNAHLHRQARDILIAGEADWGARSHASRGGDPHDP